MLLFFNKELRRTPCTFERLGLKSPIVSKLKKVGILVSKREHNGMRKPTVFFYVAEKYRDSL